MSHFRETCPNCYMNKGFSIALKEKDGVWECERCGSKFKVGEDGYFKKVS